MSITTLLSETVTILRHTPGARDEYGNVAATWPAAETVRCRLEQRRSIEVTQDRQTVVSDWVLYLHPDQVITAKDRFLDRFGRTFTVVGAPAMQSTPTRDAYVEVSLRHFSS